MKTGFVISPRMAFTTEMVARLLSKAIRNVNPCPVVVRLWRSGRCGCNVLGTVLELDVY